MTDDANKLVAGELEAIFLPGQGMLGASFRHRGEELLRRLENLEAAAAKGSTAGIPLLYPYAQVFAPKGKDFVALEPMTAPTSALTSGHGLRVIKPGEDFNAAFRIGIQA